jgi:hypothetical protein
VIEVIEVTEVTEVTDVTELTDRIRIDDFDWLKVQFSMFHQLPM